MSVVQRNNLTFAQKYCCPASMPEHILNKDSVASGGILHQHMGHGAHEFAVLNDRSAAHGHVNTGVKDFSRFLEKIISICRKQYIFDHL